MKRRPGAGRVLGGEYLDDSQVGPSGEMEAIENEISRLRRKGMEDGRDYSPKIRMLEARKAKVLKRWEDGNVRKNPDGGAPSRTEKLYNTWHKREPREEKRQRASIPENMHCVGVAKEILYSSNKWEKSLGTKHNYIHNFDSKPKVYCTKPLPGQARSNPTCQARRLLGGYLEQVPLTQLGYVLELIAIVDGEEYVFPLSGKPMMCSTEDAKGVVILNKGGIIIVRGGQMTVESRGIVK